MSKGIRKSTVEHIETLRNRAPLALGPYLGALAVSLEVPASLVGKFVDAHEQTVVRWSFHRSPIHPGWAHKVAQLITLLSWMNDTDHPPLSGNAEDREAQLLAALREFRAIAKASAKTKAVA